MKARDGSGRALDSGADFDKAHAAPIDADENLPLVAVDGPQSGIRREAIGGIEIPGGTSARVRLRVVESQGLSKAPKAAELVRLRASRFAVQKVGLVRLPLQYLCEPFPIRRIPPFQGANPARRANAPLAVADVVPEFADDHEPCECRKRSAASRIVAVDCLEQAERCNLLQVGALEPITHVAPRPSPAQMMMGEDGLLADLRKGGGRRFG